ncbi:hypothetical protein H4582DRAFT_2081532 [Lactarius indigo]|nr:hypothetical protein H4582DRAFT_2081532 [Lactarius indigo]
MTITEEATATLDELITSSPTGGEFVDSAQQLVTLLATIRSFTQGTPEYVEEAIHHIHGYTGPSSFKESYAEVAAQQRLHYFGSIEDREVLSGNSSSPLSQPAPVTSFEDPKIGPVEKLQLLDELLSANPQ